MYIFVYIFEDMEINSDIRNLVYIKINVEP